jgi:hypothetical protein
MPRPFLMALAAVCATSLAAADEPKWKKHDINPRSEFEAAGVFDVDNDGKLDIVAGGSWYNAPDWTPYPVREVKKQGTYYNDFATLPYDVNGDGKTDFVTVSYFGADVGWVENPGEKGKSWAYHEVDKPGNIEAAVAVDLTGDGVPEVLPNAVQNVVWYELTRNGGSQRALRRHDFGPLSRSSAGHGVGSGDVNGDGRIDLLTPKGWFEAPSQPASQPWTWHGDWNLGAAGIQILARDVDGDGLADVIWGNGHNYGLFWMRQEHPGTDGRLAWGKPQEIDKTIASVHTLLWADLNGDGKRVYAHEVEPGDTDASIVAWYAFDRGSRAWTRHVIYQGEPANDAPKEGAKRNAQNDFAPGTAGTGLQMTAVDIDKDGDIDLVCPGKSGLYLFENLSK